MSTKLIDMTKQLKTFLSSTSPSTRLRETTGISGDAIIEAHIRKSRLVTDRFGILRLVECAEGEFNCLDIVNVAVAERNRRKGLFTDFLELLEGFDYDCCRDAGSDFHIRIDRVMNPVLDAFLPKRGYTATRTGDETHYSYHKRVLQTLSSTSRTFSSRSFLANGLVISSTFFVIKPLFLMISAV